jgi:hypothetical protein
MKVYAPETKQTCKDQHGTTTGTERASTSALRKLIGTQAIRGAKVTL